jgi:amidase
MPDENASLPFDYPTASAGALVEALARCEVSALALTETAIARIESTDGHINAVVVRDFERARAAAHEADAALARGERRPLLGLPITVKEAHHTVGMATTWGLEPFAGWAAETDSVGVARLKAAGAVILGKTNVPPNLGDWQSSNPVYGRTRNPHDPSRTPGGSSGGSAAALAAGMVALELGSDIGGSIRVPAHFCGVFGHKPSWGLISTAGHSPPTVTGGAEIHFGTIGPMARSASDLALALGVLAGPTGIEAKAWRIELPPSRHARLTDFRVLVLDSHPLAAVSREVKGALIGLADKLAAAGAKVERESPFLPDLAAAHGQYMTMMGVLMNMGAPPREGAPPPMTAEAWVVGLHMREAFRAAWERLFQDFDVVIAPPFGTAAYPHDDRPMGERDLILDGEAIPYFSQLAWPGIATFPGLPATCAPVGRTADGLPMGVQIIGSYWEDLTTIGLAKLMEQDLGLGALPPLG